MRDNLEIKEVLIESGSLVRRFVVVHSPQQAERDRQIRDALVERLETEDVDQALAYAAWRVEAREVSLPVA